VVDRGKGPRGVFFKASMTCTSGLDPGKLGSERNQGKNESMEEEAKETQSEIPYILKTNLMEGRNPCKPKTTMIPKVVLVDLQMQFYRDRMKAHALICKFMGLWPTERTLCNWIKYHWKTNGEVELQLGSKGFFIAVFINLEDRDRIFEGGPYFHASVGLYMQPWKENFSPKK